MNSTPIHSPSGAGQTQDPNSTSVVAIRDLSHSYEIATGDLTVLSHVDLEIERGEIVAVTGPSGAGKTTLLSLMGGLDRVQRGTLQVCGHELATLSGDELAEYRRTTVGFVFQDFGLLPTLNAAENIELALTLAGVARRQRHRRALELLDQVGLSARADHRPSALSGGESQRVAIARALANDPQVVLADEPTGNLDELASGRILAMLMELPKDRGCTVVMVTHNTSIARQCDREFVLASPSEVVS